MPGKPLSTASATARSIKSPNRTSRQQLGALLICCISKPAPSHPMVKHSRSPFDEARRARVAAEPTEPTSSSSWAVKRARGARCRRHVPSRCWADLTYGPAAVIAEYALANDVSDYMSFRAVCREWRRGAVDVPRPQGCLDRRFLPRHWIMLQEVAPPGPGHQRRRFLNVSTGKCVQTELPELDGHLLAGATTEGLLALVDESTHVVRLLNPITRQLVELPSLNTPMTAEVARSVSDNRGFNYEYSISGIGLADDGSTVALCLSSLLLVAKPGDDCWRVCDGAHYFHSAMSFAGRFYCVAGYDVMALEVTAAAANEPPRLEAVVEVTFRVSGMQMDTVHLLESDGKLLLLCSWIARSKEENYWMRKYEVYRVDHDAHKIVPVRGLRCRAVFVGKVRALPVSTGVFPSIRSNTVYGGYNGVVAYNLHDRKITERWNRTRPCGVAEDLYRHVSSTNGKVEEI